MYISNLACFKIILEKIHLSINNRFFYGKAVKAVNFLKLENNNSDVILYQQEYGTE